MKEDMVKINGLNINYKMAGDGQPVLILHGWGGSSDTWKEVVEFLSRGYRVICPDLPGFGKSQPPLEPWSVGDYCDFFLSFLKHFEVDTFFLVGHSFGGRMSLKLAGKNPERIKKIVLCNSAGIKPKPGLKTHIIFLFARIGNALFTPHHFARLKHAFRGFFYTFLRSKDYVKAKGVMRETIVKVLEEDLLPIISGIKIKTLIVWGEKDKMVPVKYAYLFKDKLDNSRLEIFPKVGHSPQIEVPEKLSEVISNFLKE